MARALRSFALFSAVILGCGALTVAGLSFTAETVAKVAASSPVKTTNRKPSYVARLPVAKADDLNVAKSVPVTPVALTEPAPLAVSPAPAFTHTVAVEAVRVRSGPKKTNPQVFTLKGGSWVNVTDTVRGWVLITDETGRSGWVYGSLLRPARSAVAQIQ
ncbi:MAG: hypothetical protein JWQ89_3100 [Devosia sp.]|uniref:SH3 domain-containing protein n=1 Tax=Devosia sp. TaxID=1871048 RepID=UPI00262DEF1A|nr:SH3 domain-containing protein [Devosia sp.]MDB5541373.1 hypothetical protein [Devosia sp.]